MSGNMSMTVSRKRKAPDDDLRLEAALSSGLRVLRLEDDQDQVKEGGLLTLEGEDFPEAAKPILKPVKLPSDGPISLRQYAEILAKTEALGEVKEEDEEVHEDDQVRMEGVVMH